MCCLACLDNDGWYYDSMLTMKGTKQMPLAAQAMPFPSEIYGKGLLAS